MHNSTLKSKTLVTFKEFLTYLCEIDCASVLRYKRMASTMPNVHKNFHSLK